MRNLLATVKMRGFVLLPAACLALAAGSSPAATAQGDDRQCRPPTVTRQVTPKPAQAALRARHRSVVTFLGYSDADYQDRAAMLATATAVLDPLDPSKTIVNIGATPSGIGAVYELAKKKGFVTAGIVSSVARREKVALSPCVDLVFYIADTEWGGFVGNTARVTPTSRAMVDVSDRVVAIGGGEVSRAEYVTAERAGKKVSFFPADMNHEKARVRAESRKQPAPTDFRGALGAALSDPSRKKF